MDRIPKFPNYYMIREINNNDVDHIVAMFKNSYGIDFSNYAPSSLKRRFLRFMEIRNIWDPNELIRMTKKEKDFAQDFINEVTVNVTEMFRDPGFWGVFKNTVLPSLSSKKEINIWHAACSTGEEVYSMAILLKEAGLLERSKILATDINQSALDFARFGMFPLKKKSLNEANYDSIQTGNDFSQYFTEEDKHLVLNDGLMKNISFKRHDLARALSPGEFDVIICRNVFIYFNKYLQDRVLNMFANSLNEHGYLGIGAKESIAWCRSARMFKVIDSEEKVFKKIST